MRHTNTQGQLKVFGEKFSMGTLNKRSEKSELFYSSQYRSVPLNSCFYKRDDKSQVRLKYFAGFQSIFYILMKYAKGKF